MISACSISVTFWHCHPYIFLQWQHLQRSSLPRYVAYYTLILLDPETWPTQQLSETEYSTCRPTLWRCINTIGLPTDLKRSCSRWCHCSVHQTAVVRSLTQYTSTWRPSTTASYTAFLIRKASQRRICIGLYQCDCEVCSFVTAGLQEAPQFYKDDSWPSLGFWPEEDDPPTGN